MNAIILSIGDELVLGQTVDTNSAWLSQQLAAVGCEISAHQTVPDDQKAIERAIHAAAGNCNFLIISGGIGPTEDDLTRQALAAFMKTPLELNEAWLIKLESFFAKLGRKMPPTNRIQAMIPHGAEMVENTAGTAAGISATVEGVPNLEPDFPRVSEADLARLFGSVGALDNRMIALRERMKKKPTRVFVMPGVPKEMKIMFTRDVLPHIQAASSGGVILSKTLHTFGLGESAIAEKLVAGGDLMKRDRNPSVGTTVANGIVSLRINARFASKEEAQTQLDATAAACRAALGDLIFGQDDDTLPSVVAQLLNPKSAIEEENERRKRRTVTTAESCTGGLLAKMLTDIPGSSDYFKQGWITYSNKAKTDRLGVSENILNVHGAVSEPVVSAMATAAKRLSKADFALAISGIAGPGGGTDAKKVGTVCIALAHAEGESVRTFLFSGDREMIRDRAAKMALTLLRFHFLGSELPF